MREGRGGKHVIRPTLNHLAICNNFRHLVAKRAKQFGPFGPPRAVVIAGNNDVLAADARNISIRKELVQQQVLLQAGYKYFISAAWIIPA